tara:strand:- start:1337 stop:1519 length:183 start_codon:yes stop_codon:yes gene_type:complete
MKRLIHQVKHNLPLTKEELYIILQSLKSEKEVRYIHNTAEEILEHHEKIDAIINKIRKID